MRFLLLFLLLSTLSYSQQAKDTKVIVKASDTTNLFSRVVMALYERGYTLEQKDETLKFVATTEKSIPREAISIKVRALVKDDTVTFSGLFTMELGRKEDREYTPIEYRKGKIWSNVHFKVLEELAKEIGDNITYSK